MSVACERHSRYVFEQSMEPIISTFATREQLSEVERLAAMSFLAHGHEYHIYSYRRPSNAPPQAKWRDAADILPFREGVTPDQFRWEWLAREGGVWANSDIVCLRPIEIDDEFQCVFDSVKVITAAFVKAPARHPITRRMRYCSRHPVWFALRHPEAWPHLPPLWGWRAEIIRRRLKDQLDGTPEFSRIVLRRYEFLSALPAYYFFPVREPDSASLYDATWSEQRNPFEDSMGVCLFADKHAADLRAINSASFVGGLMRQYDLI